MLINNRLHGMALLLMCSALAWASGETPLIPKDSTIFVDSNNGFEIFIQAAFQAKHVRVKLVTSRNDADYVLDSSLFHSQEFAATEKVAGTYRTSEAAFKLTSKAGDVIWAYAATKGMLSRGGGKQSVAESCAKHLREVIQK